MQALVTRLRSGLQVHVAFLSWYIVHLVFGRYHFITHGLVPPLTPTFVAVASSIRLGQGLSCVVLYTVRK